MGNRDEDPPEVPAWCARAERAHANMLENLPVFTAMVLAVHMAGRSGDASALGAQVFLACRVAHGTSYLLGIPVVRTLFHFGGMGAILWMGSALL